MERAKSYGFRRILRVNWTPEARGQAGRERRGGWREERLRGKGKEGEVGDGSRIKAGDEEGERGDQRKKKVGRERETERERGGGNRHAGILRGKVAPYEKSIR